MVTIDVWLFSYDGVVWCLSGAVYEFFFITVLSCGEMFVLLKLCVCNGMVTLSSWRFGGVAVLQSWWYDGI